MCFPEVVDYLLVYHGRSRDSPGRDKPPAPSLLRPGRNRPSPCRLRTQTGTGSSCISLPQGSFAPSWTLGFSMRTLNTTTACLFAAGMVAASPDSPASGAPVTWAVPASSGTFSAATRRSASACPAPRKSRR